MDSLLNTPSLSPEPITGNQQATPFPHAKQQMTSDSGERRLSRLGTRTPEPELPCPRCNSTNTKFCYYNNYNLSQPRHFCKSCRRYWTRGGALRNVPVGGGSRKAVSSNKRTRVATTTTPTTSTTTTGSSSDALVSGGSEHDGAGQTQTFDPVISNPTPSLGSGSLTGGSLTSASVSLSDGGTIKSGSLNSWWGGQIGLGGGLLPFYGYGLGHGPGHGLGVWDWPMEQVAVENGGATVVSGDSPGCNTWQMGGGGGGSEGILAEGDYFSWPELAISTPAKAFK